MRVLASCLPLACAVALTACTLDDTPPPDLDTIDLLGVPPPDVVANGIPSFDVVANGISSFPAARTAFAQAPLSTATFVTGPKALATLTPNTATRTFLRYTVGCALDHTQSVAFHGDVYSGELGLCPSWNDGPPTHACLDAVSACLIARNNVLDKRVVISPRGLRAEGDPLNPDGPVPADSHTGDPEAPIIGSFAACTGGQTGADRDCGWSTSNSWTGSCQPGASVTVSASIGYTCGKYATLISYQPVLRVCGDRRGCNHNDATVRGEADGSCGTAAVDIVCPTDGAFVAMVGSYDPSIASHARVEAGSDRPVQLAAWGSDFFAVREGAFFGNLFSAQNPNLSAITGANGEVILKVKPAGGGHTGIGSPRIYPNEDAWACHDPGYDKGDAYLDARLCAVHPVLPVDDDGNPAVDLEGNPIGPVDANLCVARPLGACSASMVSQNGDQCGAQDESGTGEYGGCQDGAGKTRELPMTVYLHHSCDLLPPGMRALCIR